jgi:prevent-host-death family protein
MSKAERHVNTVEAKNRFNELIAEVEKTKKPIIVEKRNQPVAVVVSYENYCRQSASSKKKDDSLFAELSSFHQVMRKKYPQGTGDSAEILREVRLERSKP